MIAFERSPAPLPNSFSIGRSRRPLETFTEPRPFVENPLFDETRQHFINSIDLNDIDPPIVELIKRFNLRAECFTLQSCYGHFLYAPAQKTRHLGRLPPRLACQINYRIAYIAFCIANSPRGHLLRESLEHMPTIDPDYVQFGSADWFWERHPNSYVLQMMPSRHQKKDQVLVDYPEALHLEQVRDLFFEKMTALVDKPVHF
jgi:hypothetical protein